MPDEFAIGLMSGTSADGIDVALVKISHAGRAFPAISLHQALFVPFTEEQRQRIFALFSPEAPILAVGKLHRDLGLWFSDAVNQVLQVANVLPRQVRIIGCHGQTIAHYPQHHFTFQIGDPATIAAKTGIDVVSMFRAMDMAVDGQGAPLVPYFDFAQFQSQEENRVLLNVGGIANITILPKNGGQGDVLGFDTGPGNMVLDGLMSLLTKGSQTYDHDGAFAAQGEVRQDILDRWLSHPYFSAPAPKSTGREDFGMAHSESLYKSLGHQQMGPFDLLRTATALVAETIARGMRQYAPAPFALIASGGGAKNPTLMEELSHRLPLLRPWESSTAYGVPDDAKEAMAFAYLAWQFVHGRPTNVPHVTGATGTVMQGTWTPAGEGRVIAPPITPG